MNTIAIYHMSDVAVAANECIDIMKLHNF